MDAAGALVYVFSPDAKPYTAERVCWHVPVTFRVLPSAEKSQSDILADALPSPVAAARFRAVGAVARAIVAVDGEEVPGGMAPDAEQTAQRIAWIDSQPEDYIVVLADAYEDVRKEFVALMSEDSVKNSSGSVGGPGAS